jgi:hypothetical protein
MEAVHRVLLAVQAAFGLLAFCGRVSWGAEGVQFVGEIDSAFDGASMLLVRPSKASVLQVVPVVRSCREYRLTETTEEARFRVFTIVSGEVASPFRFTFFCPVGTPETLRRPFLTTIPETLQSVLVLQDQQGIVRVARLETPNSEEESLPAYVQAFRRRLAFLHEHECIPAGTVGNDGYRRPLWAFRSRATGQLAEPPEDALYPYGLSVLMAQIDIVGLLAPMSGWMLSSVRGPTGVDIRVTALGQWDAGRLCLEFAGRYVEDRTGAWFYTIAQDSVGGWRIAGLQRGADLELRVTSERSDGD